MTLEGLIDRVAVATNLSPVEVREKNLIARQDFPYRSPTGALYDSGDYLPTFRRALGLSRYEKWRAEQRVRRSSGERLAVGIGISCYIERSGGAPGSSEFGSVEVQADRSVIVRTGSTSQGQGHETMFARLAAGFLDLPEERVHVVQGDTDLVPRGVGTFASRSTQVGGAAIGLAADQLLSEARRRAADRLEVDSADLEYSSGRFSARGAPTLQVTLAELAEDDALAMEADAHPPQAFPFGAYVVVVEVDLDTGSVRLSSVTGVEDCGVLCDHVLVHGQMMGAIAQGAGQALMEHAEYSTDGQPLNATLADYLLPLSTDIPQIGFDNKETPNPNVPHGAKGAGEGGCIGVAPAVVGAVLDAVGLHGEKCELPLTADRVLAIIAGRETEV